jgi:hypothetical protein
MSKLSLEELRSSILHFLKDFKELMGQGHYVVMNHYKNLQTLRDLGITARIRDEFILSIALENYTSGPNPDDLHPGDYWVFGKRLDAKEIYIKLKIVTYNNGNERAVCISFHPSEYRLNHPFLPQNPKGKRRGDQ